MKVATMGLTSVLALSSCATSSPMPDEKYAQFAGFAAGTQKCFEAGLMEPKMYAETKDATRVVLGSWTLDNAKMKNAMAESYRQLRTPTAQDCRQVEGTAYEMIGASGRHRANVEANDRDMKEAVNQFNSSVRKPVWCNRFGSTVMCN